MKSLVSVVVALCCLNTYAQKTSSTCERDADAKLNEMWTASATAGTVTYKKIMDRALACVQAGLCSKPEALVRIQEIMVDEEVIELQRKKVAVMRTFASTAGPAKDACAVVALLSPLMEEITVLNLRQLRRFESLSAQSYPSR